LNSISGANRENSPKEKNFFRENLPKKPFYKGGEIFGRKTLTLKPTPQLWALNLLKGGPPKSRSPKVGKSL